MRGGHRGFWIWIGQGRWKVKKSLLIECAASIGQFWVDRFALWDRIVEGGGVLEILETAHHRVQLRIGSGRKAIIRALLIMLIHWILTVSGSHWRGSAFGLRAVGIVAH